VTNVHANPRPAYFEILDAERLFNVGVIAGVKVVRKLRFQIATVDTIMTVGFSSLACRRAYKR